MPKPEKLDFEAELEEMRLNHEARRGEKGKCCIGQEKQAILVAHRREVLGYLERIEAADTNHTIDTETGIAAIKKELGGEPRCGRKEST